MTLDTRPRLALAGVKPQARKRTGRFSHRLWRRLSQIGFAAFIAFVIVQHWLAGDTSATTAASAEAFCPFGGLETLYHFVTSSGKFVPHVHMSNLVLAVAVLLTALLARSAFCGWICPLGFLQDLASGASSQLQRRVPAVHRFVRTLKTRAAFLAVLDRPLRFLKYGVLVWAVGGAALFGVMVSRDYDPWAALLTIAEFSLTPGLLVLLVTLGASFFVERPWCRYACPLGAASGLVARLGPVYLKRHAPACHGCAVCNKACPMGLDVAKAATIKSPDCIGCLECVASCPRAGALELKVGLPAVGK